MLTLVIMVFVPIKYVYPSRLDYLTHNVWLQWFMLIASLLWGVGTAAMLWSYPNTNRFMVFLSIGYALLYVLFSFYRTFVPLEGVSLEDGKGPRVYIPKKGSKDIPADPPPG